MTRRPITPQDLWALRRVGHPAVAPDGSFAIVPVTSTTCRRTGTHPPVAGGAGRLPPALTSPGTDSTNPVLSPDGSRVAFLRKEKEDDKPQLHVLRLDGGEALCLTDLPLGRGPPLGPCRQLPGVPRPLLAGHESPEATRTELAARKERKVQAR